MQQVQVVGVEDAGFYSSEYISGSTVTVTMQRGADVVKCEGIVLWEEEYVGDDLFDEWVGYAVDGEEGYTATLVEAGRTVEYSAQGKRVVE
jgi:hypothetical protein